MFEQKRSRRNSHMFNVTNLICIPYEGGYSACYYRWKSDLNQNIKMTTVELAGRGRRIKEPSYVNITEAVEDIYRNIAPMVAQEEYVMFGHSMGSVLAFEVMQKIIKRGDRLPKHIILSGSDPIHRRKKA